MSYANYDDDCFDDFDEDDDDWQVGDDTPCQKGNTVTAALSGSSKPCDDVPHADLPTGEQAFTHRTVPGDTRGRAQDSGGFPQQVATNTHESASSVLSNTRTQPATTQTKGTGTSTGTVRQPTSVCRRVEEHGVVADTNGVSEVVRNNPNVSPAWIKQMLTNEQEGSKAPVGSKQVDQEWLSTIKIAYAQRHMNQAATPQLLRQCFNSVVNPYTTALYLYDNAADHSGHSGKQGSLCSCVMSEFENWTKRNHVRYSHCLDDPIKMAMFQSAIANNMVAFDLIVKAFCLSYEGSDNFVMLVRQFVQQKKYKEAALCITRLNLQEHFDIKEVVLPLLLQDKVNLVESYVYRHPDQQMALLKLIDYLIDRDTDIGSVIREANVPSVKPERLQRKVLSKLATRLMKLYQIPQELLPNVNNSRSFGGLRYLLYKKYVEKTLGSEQWDDLVKSMVDDNEWLKEQLVEQLVSYLDMKEAARWAIHYNLPAASLPHQVAHELQETSHSFRAVGTEPEDWEDDCTGESLYHSLTLDPCDINWVDTSHAFHLCLTDISQPGTIVGLDAEWRPGFGQATVSRMALLQLATAQHVFLLDMLTLTDVLTDHDWNALAEQLFANEHVLIVGYGISGDIQVLMKTYPCMKDALKMTKSVIDLQKIYEQIRKVQPDAFSSSHHDNSCIVDDVTTAAVATPGRGLSELVRQCLGRPLDKQQQLSDWERRPLRQNQIVYAALDAYCLLEVYEVLKLKIQSYDLSIDWEPSVNAVFVVKTSRSEKKQKRAAEKKLKPAAVAHRMVAALEPSTDRPTMAPSELLVVVDNMLQGLGRQLRCCGVDVVILENTDCHDRAGEIARAEGRVILTSGMPYQTLKSQVPEGHCLNVRSDRAQEQVLDILQHFNVKVTHSDILSRCQLCNCNKYLHISGPEMQAAWIKRRTEWPEAFSHAAGPSSEGSRHKSTGACELSRSVMLDTDQPTDHIDMTTLTVGNHVRLQLDTVPGGIFDKVELFYVCASCGKVYWDGVHYGRVCERFAHILGDDDSSSPQRTGTTQNL
ncbi:3'-5' exonuclease domain-containing protein [Lamellibrachia satsuma]|nr:3'-5' exonuclease domain-containing protein [Lamellibrachia satsuma]